MIQEQIKSQYEQIAIIVSEYETAINKKHNLDMQLLEVKENKFSHESEAKAKVYEAVDDVTGKKKFTNEEMRNIATSKYLETKSEYVQLKKATETYEKEISKLSSQLTILNMRLSMMKKQADLVVALASVMKE